MAIRFFNKVAHKIWQTYFPAYKLKASCGVVVKRSQGVLETFSINVEILLKNIAWDMLMNIFLSIKWNTKMLEEKLCVIKMNIC